MEQEDLLLRCHLRGIGSALGSAALLGAIIVSTGAKCAVKSSCALPQHVTVLCIGRRHLRHRFRQILEDFGKENESECERICVSLFAGSPETMTISVAFRCSKRSSKWQP